MTVIWTSQNMSNEEENRRNFYNGMVTTAVPFVPLGQPTAGPAVISVGMDMMRSKRLTREQHNVLEAEFLRDNKPNTAYKKDIAYRLGVAPDKINNWYQNRRAKVKQDKKKQSQALNMLAAATQPYVSSVQAISQPQAAGSSVMVPSTTVSAEPHHQPVQPTTGLAEPHVQPVPTTTSQVESHAQSVPTTTAPLEPQLQPMSSSHAVGGLDLSFVPFVMSESNTSLSEPNEAFFDGNPYQNTNFLSISTEDLAFANNLNATAPESSNAAIGSMTNPALIPSPAAEPMNVSDISGLALPSKANGTVNLAARRKKARPAALMLGGLGAAGARSASYSGALPASPGTSTLGAPNDQMLRRIRSANNCGRIQKTPNPTSGQPSPVSLGYAEHLMRNHEPKSAIPTTYVSPNSYTAPASAPISPESRHLQNTPMLNRSFMPRASSGSATDVTSPSSAEYSAPPSTPLTPDLTQLHTMPMLGGPFIPQVSAASDLASPWTGKTESSSWGASMPFTPDMLAPDHSVQDMQNQIFQYNQVPLSAPAGQQTFLMPEFSTMRISAVPDGKHTRRPSLPNNNAAPQAQGNEDLLSNNTFGMLSNGTSDKHPLDPTSFFLPGSSGVEIPQYIEDWSNAVNAV